MEGQATQQESNKSTGSIDEGLIQDNRRLIRELSRLEDHFNPGVKEAGIVGEQTTTCGIRVVTRSRVKGGGEPALSMKLDAQ